MIRTTASAVTALALVLTLGACGSGDDDEADGAEDAEAVGGAAGDDDRGIYEDYPLIPLDADEATPAPGEITSDGPYYCDGDQPEVRVQGDGLEVGLGGGCEALIVDGTGNTIELERSDTVTLNGSRHDLSVAGGVGTVVLTGDGHAVHLQEGGGAALVQDSSAESEIEGNHVEDTAVTTMPTPPMPPPA
jgi:hypothetical protein